MRRRCASVCASDVCCRYCSACGHVASVFNELAGPLFKKTLSSEKKMNVAAKVLADVCSKSGIDSVSGNAGSRKFVNFMKMQQVEGSFRAKITRARRAAPDMSSRRVT